MRTIAAKVLSLLGVAVLAAGCGGSGDEQEADTWTPPETVPGAITPVIASVVAAPVPVRATDGKTHLAYELQLTNTLGSPVDLAALSVKAGDRNLLTLSGANLAYWTRALGAGQTPTTTLGPGQSGVVWLDVAVDGDAPKDLTHALEVKVSKPMPPLFPATMTEDVAPVTVSDHQPAVIAPPLRGPKWLDGSSCCDMTAHRMAMNPLNGGLWAAERFAIDYVQLSDNGTIFSGDKTKPESYPYFGADIHAVADGHVVSVINDLPEQVAGRSPTGLPLEQYGGNHVVQEIDDGQGGHYYAFYAHLKTGTVAVKPGDQLTKGQVIAQLGNTGNSDAPHLHFHVMSTPDPLRSNGLPFVFESYRLDGEVTSMAALDPLLDGKPAAMRPGFGARDETRTSPLVLDVMSYE